MKGGERGSTCFFRIPLTDETTRDCNSCLINEESLDCLDVRLSCCLGVLQETRLSLFYQLFIVILQPFVYFKSWMKERNLFTLILPVMFNSLVSSSFM